MATSRHPTFITTLNVMHERLLLCTQAVMMATMKPMTPKMMPRVVAAAAKCWCCGRSTPSSLKSESPLSSSVQWSVRRMVVVAMMMSGLKKNCCVMVAR